MALVLPVRDGRVLVARRPDGVPMAGYWEFPGGKIVPGEEPAAAARRELREETGLAAGELEALVDFVHEYPERTIRFHVFLARLEDDERAGEPRAGWVWKSGVELGRLRMPAANSRVLESLARREP